MSENALSIWNEKQSLSEIKAQFGANLTDGEFSMLCGIGKATGLNPFLREIWAVKYGTAQASIFIGRDGYRKSAQAHHDYDYHFADSVYENDQFSVKNGEIDHTYTLKDRGKILGAYCIVKRKNSSKPNFVFVEIKEYSTGKSLWQSKPSTMIKKVAEAQCLRMTFQELFAGSYDESENWNEEKTKAIPVKEIKNITKEQESRIIQLFIELEKDDKERNERMKKALSAFKKKNFKELSENEANTLISSLENKVNEKKSKEVEEEVKIEYPRGEEENQIDFFFAENVDDAKKMAEKRWNDYCF